MIDDLITTKEILDWLRKQVNNKLPISPDQYLEAASRLNILLSDENDKLFTLEQQVSRQRIELLEAGMNVSQTKMRVEATDEYREARRQRSLIEQIKEQIKIAKLQGRIKSEELRSNV